MDREPGGTVAPQVDGFPGYVVRAELGRGADATVLCVQRTADDGTYALKVIDRPADETAVALCREAALLAAVKHPDLVRIHEVGRHDGRPYLVMDLVEGRSLARLLHDGPLPADRVVSLALELADPLSAIHRAGLVHRDIKPDNVMVQPDGRARLIDFGMAARETNEGSETAVGTLLYSSPEQAGTLRRPVDQRSDLYSLGVVLYECLAGRPPFAGSDVGDLLRMHAVEAPPDLLGLAPGTPPDLASVVATLLAKEPDDRYQTGADLVADLLAVRHRAGGDEAPERAAASREPFVGRSDELNRLRTAWDLARRGTGGVVAVRGGGGAGKTRLVRELMAAADGAAVVLYANGSPDDPVPMAPLRRALDGHLRELPSEAYEGVRACAGAAAPTLATLSPDLAAVLGPTADDDDGHQRFPAVVAAFLAALAGAGGGLMLVVDDAQWLDDASRRVLAQLAGDLAAAPVLLVVAGRNDGDVLSGLGARVDVDLTLAPLPADAVTDLVLALLPGTRPDDALVRRLVTRSKGNPFVVHEYLRAIADAGLVCPSWGRWLLDEAGLDALDLPEDALGLLLARLDSLDPGAVDVLTTAAVAGTEFAPDVLVAVLGRPAEEVHGALHEAGRLGLVEPRAGGGVGFLHVGIRDALAAMLDPPDVAARHLAIARTLAPELVYAIAQHYLQSGGAAPPAEAVPAFVAAGTLALRDHAPADAVTFLGRAVELTGSEPSLLHPLGTALLQTGRNVEAGQRLEEALGSETDPLRRAEILVTLADVCWAGWRAADGSATVERGLAELGVRLPRRGFALLLTSLAMFVAVLVTQYTRLGAGTVRADRRRRCELIAGLHTMGFYLAGMESRLPAWLAHGMRAVYLGNRIGAGPRYVRGQYLLGIFGNIARLKRVAVTAFARMNADPAVAEPGLRAMTAYGQALSRYMIGRGPESAVFRVLEERGRWLDVGTYSEGAFAMVLDLVGQGRNEDAARVAALAERRVAAGVGERSALSLVPVLLAAAHGRLAEAARQLEDLEGDLDAVNGIAARHYLSATQIQMLTEQREFGPLFDDAVALYDSANVPPAVVARPHRGTLFRIAMGRIARYRAATDEPDRAARLAQARAALRDVGKGARDPISKTHLALARADLLVATGEARRAIRLLHRDEAIHRPPAPLVDFDRARVLARAYAELDAPALARRQVQVALGIAEEEGWPHRAGWVTAEFRSRLRTAQSSTATAMTQMRTSTRLGSTGGSGIVAGSNDRQRLRALERLGVAASRILDPEALARTALDEIIQILHADRAFLFLAGERDEPLRPHQGRAIDGTDLGELAGYSTSLVERVRVGREPLVIAGTEEGAALGAQSVVQFGLRSILIAPLLLDDRLLGVVYLDSKVAKGIFTADDASTLIALAHHIAVALETARAAQLEISEQAARRQRDMADGLRAAFEAMTDTLDPAAVLARLLQRVGALVPNDGVWLLMPSGILSVADDGTPTRQPIEDDPTVAGLLAIEQPASDLPVPPSLAARAPAATGWVILPLRTRDAAPGTLVLATTDAEHHPEVVAALAAQGMTAYENASLFARVQELATVDELTGIANRRRFFELAEREVASAARQGRSTVAMMLDIDHFKRVNDTHGHPSGDDVIREVARRLAEQMRGTDVLGRYGGEEFAMVFAGTDLAGGRALAERMRRCIAAEPVSTRTGPVPVTASIGLALVDVDEDVGVVLARADGALYRAKQTGRNRVCDDVT